jgi:hypothetical protein
MEHLVESFFIRRLTLGTQVSNMAISNIVCASPTRKEI